MNTTTKTWIAHGNSPGTRVNTMYTNPLCLLSLHKALFCFRLSPCLQGWLTWQEYRLICRFGKRTVCSYHSETRRITVSEVSHILPSLLLPAVSGARQDEAMPSGFLRRGCPYTLLLMCAHSALLSPVLKTSKSLFLNIRTNGLTLSDASAENTLWSITEHKTQMDWCMYYASTENKQKSVPEHVRLNN